ncbi:hypothetical protein CYMTET_42257, partial [Cymbomonas tetramitiformis]
MIMENEKGTLEDVAPLLEFQRFPENRHTGPALSRHYNGVLTVRKLSMKSISLPTADGASNNKKAFKILKKRLKAARGVKQMRSVLRVHRVRWHGIYRMLKNNRKLESDIKVALTGARSGICGEVAAYLAPPGEASDPSATMAGDTDISSGGENSESSGGEESEDSDGEQVEANQREEKEFPLQHRCLTGSEWSKNNQVESCFAPIHDVSVDLQAHTGAGLDLEYTLACALHQNLTAMTVDTVSGADEEETWNTVHADTLPADLKQFRRVVAQQVEARMLTLDEDTLISLKMNPSLDTSAEGTLFKDKQGSFELMEAGYNRQLRVRGTFLLQGGLLDTAGSATGKGVEGDATRSSREQSRDTGG